MIQSVDRAARILQALASGGPSLGVTELAEGLRLAKPTVHGLLRTLVHSGLVQQDISTGRYFLGPGVLRLGNAYLAGSELRSRSMMRALDLAQQVNESVWVTVLTAESVTVVHHEFRPDDAVQILEVGATVPWHACALGHAIVAHLDDSVVNTMLGVELRALTGRTKTSPTVLRKVLAGVRSKGVAVEDQEATVGDAGIAAPVFDHSGHAVGAIGLVGPVDRLLSRQRKSPLERAVMNTAWVVSRELGAPRTSRSPLRGPGQHDH